LDFFFQQQKKKLYPPPPYTVQTILEHFKV
jgi:hypothetical protein